MIIRAALIAGLMLTASLAEAQERKTGETLYVPIYSHLSHGNLSASGTPDRMLLSATVSVRNTDPVYPIRLRFARYYDTDGKLVRDQQAAGRVIPPMATVEYFVEVRDTTGGSGANFLIGWEADAPVSPPLVESVNVSLRGSQSIAFTSRAVAVPAE
jgi:hypothetical protein